MWEIKFLVNARVYVTVAPSSPMATVSRPLYLYV